MNNVQYDNKTLDTLARNVSGRMDEVKRRLDSTTNPSIKLYLEGQVWAYTVVLGELALQTVKAKELYSDEQHEPTT